MLATAILLAALFAGVGVARAQFTIGSIARDVDNPTVDISVEPGSISAHVLNEAEVRMLRKADWRAKNNVDFRVSLNGMVTQFNKSWITNNQNSVASELAAYYYHIYTRDKYTSTFKFDGIYGMNYIDDIWFKNQDQLKLYYLMSWKMRDKGALRHWAYSFEGSFTSQFAEGYKSRTEKELWSNFMAPGSVNVGAGLTYTSPNAKLPFIVTINPVSGNGLFVLDDRIGDERRGKLGIANARDVNGRLIRRKIEGGSSVNVAFNRTFAFGDNSRVTLQYITTMSSFYGWMTQVARHETAIEGAVAPAAIIPTLGWANTFILSPLKFLTMEFRTTTLYDRSQVDKVQMQYYLRVGLTYRYKNR